MKKYHSLQTDDLLYTPSVITHQSSVVNISPTEAHCKENFYPHCQCMTLSPLQFTLSPGHLFTLSRNTKNI